MAKKRLNQHHRDLLLSWMYSEKIDKNQNKELLEEMVISLAALINPILRDKYPNSDMIVLRKYNLIRKDRCLKFQKTNGQVFGIDFEWDFGIYDALFNEHVEDIPACEGCQNNIVFEATEELENSFIAFEKLYDETKAMNKDKERKYRAFIYDCKHLEDVEAVITLPEEIRVKILGASTAISITNPELVKSIKEDFANE